MSDKEDTTMATTSEETEQVVEKETAAPTVLPEFVEINDSFDSIEIDAALKEIAETNELGITWEELQPKLESLISKQYKALDDKLTDEQTRKSADELIMKINHSINDHLNCPFTIQRLCELIIEPKRYYKVYIKYLRAVEKVLLVTSYWEDYRKQPTSASENMETDTTNVGTTTSFELEPHNFGEDTKEQENTTEQEDSLSIDPKNGEPTEPIADEKEAEDSAENSENSTKMDLD